MQKWLMLALIGCSLQCFAQYKKLAIFSPNGQILKTYKPRQAVILNTDSGKSISGNINFHGDSLFLNETYVSLENKFKSIYKIQILLPSLSAAALLGESIWVVFSFIRINQGKFYPYIDHALFGMASMIITSIVLPVSLISGYRSLHKNGNYLKVI